jgi:hypothetical protein
MFVVKAQMNEAKFDGAAGIQDEFVFQ